MKKPTVSKSGKEKTEEKSNDITVIDLLYDIIEFYKCLSYNSFPFATSTLLVKGESNVSSRIFTSIRNTLSSIKILVGQEFYNDVFALIRKYQDAVFTQICVALMMKVDKEKFYACDFDLESYDNDVSKWAEAKLKFNLKANEEKIAGYDCVKDLNKIFQVISNVGGNHVSSLSSKSLRQFCNNNLHYNSLSYFLLNDPCLLDVCGSKEELREKVNTAIINSFIFHFSYIFVINPEYLTSDDYINTLESGEEPIEKSQYWLAPFANNILKKYVMKDQELFEYLKGCNYLIINE